jgi:hypothetical protein
VCGAGLSISEILGLIWELKFKRNIGKTGVTLVRGGWLMSDLVIQGMYLVVGSLVQKWPGAKSRRLGKRIR